MLRPRRRSADTSRSLRFSKTRHAFRQSGQARPPWRLLGVLLVLGVALGVLHNRWRAQHQMDPPFGGVRLITNPIQQGTAALARPISSWWYSVTNASGMAAENARLREENSRLQLEAERLAADATETARLRELLAMPPARLEKGRVGPIITLLPSPYFETITVGCGTAQGVRDTWIARTADGLVGQVTECSLLSSQVQLLTDFTSAVSVLVVRGGKVVASGTLRGAGRNNDLDLVHVKHESVIRAGDRVVSSGYGGVVPSDIPVGRIVALNRRSGELTQSAKVTPYAGMPGNLREVLLVPSVASLQGKSAPQKSPTPAARRPELRRPRHTTPPLRAEVTTVPATNEILSAP